MAGVTGTTVTTACPSTATAVGGAGVPGATAGSGVTAGFDATDAPDAEPMPFAPETVNVYDVGGVKPATTHEVAGAVTMHEPPAGTEVTV